MCEIITFSFAIVFSLVALIQYKKNKKITKSVLITTEIFWGAALMWLIDCIVSALNHEGFFDISMQDFILGLIIAGIGLVIFVILAIKEAFSNKK